MTAEFRKAARQVGEAERTPLYKEKRGKQEATEGQVTPNYNTPHQWWRIGLLDCSVGRIPLHPARRMHMESTRIVGGKLA